MATGTLEQAVAFATKMLSKNPAMTMTELKAAAKPKGIKIFPLAIGYAKKSLGLSPPKRRTRKKRGRSGQAGGGGRGKTSRAVGGRGLASGSAGETLGRIAAQMQELERENQELRKILVRIADLAGRVR